MAEKNIPLRSQIAAEDTWDLSKLFADDPAFYQGLESYEKAIDRFESYRGTLGGSAASLTDYLDFFRDQSILGERLEYYATLRQSEDEGDSGARTMVGRLAMAQAKALTASAWAETEILSIPAAVMAGYLSQDRLGEYRIYLERLLRAKPHILSEKEERILALQSESGGTIGDIFSVLTNVDLDFGSLETPEGPRPLSQSTWSSFMVNSDRALRKKAYDTFYGVFNVHRNTLAALYAGQVKQDVIHARVRGYSSARAAALFPDNVDEGVYDNLIGAVSANLSPLHRYYRLRKKVLKVDTLRHYDVYVPMVPSLSKNTSYTEAAALVSKALSPLGDEYVHTLNAGLLGRWVDRYENRGKRSGAFSAGSFTADPYIHLNYKDDTIRDVFTLAHEGGHSMHSWYSAQSNPFMHYNYTIFEAEVASTFNEELLFRYMMEKADSPELKTYILNQRVDDILATLYRQTMFAEYEKICHHLEESGSPLTVDILRAEYRKLLEKYFGPEMTLEETSDLEALRIPHVYGAFYVYTYATGVSASIALAEGLLSGGKTERENYFNFLRSGGSRFPIDSLKTAGVDMSSPAPVEAACRIFGTLVEELEKRLS
jgi:oligoendopeptidase F